MLDLSNLAGCQFSVTEITAVFQQVDTILSTTVAPFTCADLAGCSINNLGDVSFTKSAANDCLSLVYDHASSSFCEDNGTLDLSALPDGDNTGHTI